VQESIFSPKGSYLYKCGPGLNRDCQHSWWWRSPSPWARSQKSTKFYIPLFRKSL